MAGWKEVIDWAKKNPEATKAVAGLAGTGIAAYGASQANKQNQQNIQQQRGDDIFSQQRDAILGRAGATNSALTDEYNRSTQGASQVANLTDPFNYKRELERDSSRQMGLDYVLKRLGIQPSALHTQLQNSIPQRNASAVTANEMNAQDVNPYRQGRDVGELMGLPGQFGEQTQKLGQYAGNANAQTGALQQAIMGNIGSSYDAVDKSLAGQLALNPPKGMQVNKETGELEKKPSKWRKILGGVVKYGVPIALMATGVGAGAGAGMLAAGMAGSSVAGDKIAGKSWKDAAIGGAMSAIPMGGAGAGGIGGKLTSGITNKVAQTAANQGLRAASDYIPGVGLGLAGYNALGPSLGKTAAQAATSPMTSYFGQQIAAPLGSQQALLEALRKKGTLR